MSIIHKSSTPIFIFFNEKKIGEIRLIFDIRKMTENQNFAIIDIQFQIDLNS